MVDQIVTVEKISNPTPHLNIILDNLRYVFLHFTPITFRHLFLNACTKERIIYTSILKHYITQLWDPCFRNKFQACIYYSC